MPNNPLDGDGLFDKQISLALRPNMAVVAGSDLVVNGFRSIQTTGGNQLLNAVLQSREDRWGIYFHKPSNNGAGVDAVNWGRHGLPPARDDLANFLHLLRPDTEITRYVA